jgi:hypothetical protein
MRRCERVAHLAGNRNRLGGGHAAALLQHLFEVVSLDKLHRDEHRSIGRFAEIVHIYNIGMSQSGRRACFIYEAGARCLVVDILAAQNLNGDSAIQPLIAGAENLSGSAFAYLLKQTISPCK